MRNEIKFVCLHCGHTFDEPTNRYNQRVKYYDEDGFCPNCGSEDFEEASQCSICGEWHSEDALKGGVCEDCLNKHNTIENAIAWGEDERKYTENWLTYNSIHPSNGNTPIAINAFFAYVYTAEEINEILAKDFESIKKTFPQKAQEYADRYITDDPGAFAEWFNERREDK